MRSDRFPTRLDVETKRKGAAVDARRARSAPSGIISNNTEFGQEAAARGARLRELRWKNSA
jgi:hypothetical protein